jgi:peptidoglycan-N-acetylglucosamine deacetylase
MAGCGSPRCIPLRRGQLARWRVLAGFLERVMAQGDVWFAPMEEIAAHVRREIDEGRYLPRVEFLPQNPELLGRMFLRRGHHLISRRAAPLDEGLPLPNSICTLRVASV